MGEQGSASGWSTAWRDLLGWTFVALVAGVLGGGFVHLLELGLGLCRTLRDTTPPEVVWLLPVLGSAVVGLAVGRLGRDAEGEPMPKYIHAVNRYRARIPFAQGAAALLGSFVTLGTGGSGGTTGPVVLSTAFLAGSLSDRIRGILRWFRMEGEGRNVLAVGAAAAAISAILRAPVGGGVMAVELLFRKNLEYEKLFSAILSSVGGYLVFVFLSGDTNHLFPVGETGFPGLALVPWVVGLTIAVEGMSSGFVWTYRWTRRLRERSRLAAPLRLGLGGLFVGALALGLMQLDEESGRALLGTSRAYMLEIVRSPLPAEGGRDMLLLLFVFLAAKLLATTVTVGSGNIAGFVLPTLLLGAFAGRFAAAAAGWGPIESPTEHTALLAAGVAAAIASTLNCPLASVILVTEFFGINFAWIAAVAGLSAYKISPETAVYGLGSAAHRLLLVDDDPQIRRILGDVLRKSDYAVDESDNGEEALAMAERGRYDVILLDRSLPKLSGDDVLRGIRSNPASQNQVVLLLTARKAPDERTEGLALGADDYITKPFHVPEVLQRIRQHIDRDRRQHTAILRKS